MFKHILSCSLLLSAAQVYANTFTLTSNDIANGEMLSTKHVFKGFGIEVERVVVTELKNSTYFARMILKMENELGTKIVEVDARPSDCLAIAASQKVPVFVTDSLFEEVEDMSEVLEQINQSREEEGGMVDE